MPSAAPRPCPKPGCAALIRGKQRYCVEHGRIVEAQKPERLRGRAGMVRRARFLMESPLCVQCKAEGRVTVATEVDHKTPLHMGGADEWDNLQSLCHDHHAAKSASERGVGECKTFRHIDGHRRGYLSFEPPLIA